MAKLENQVIDASVQIANCVYPVGTAPDIVWYVATDTNTPVGIYAGNNIVITSESTLELANKKTISVNMLTSIIGTFTGTFTLVTDIATYTISILGTVTSDATIKPIDYFNWIKSKIMFQYKRGNS